MQENLVNFALTSFFFSFIVTIDDGKQDSNESHKLIILLHTPCSELLFNNFIKAMFSDLTIDGIV